MQQEKLTHAQETLLKRCERHWTILPVGSTNKTLSVLIKKNYVETRILKHAIPEYCRWEWRI